LNRGGIEEVCAASGRGKAANTQQTAKREGVDVVAQLCCYVVIYITLKLNES
jgi:hypothetical protein